LKSQSKTEIALKESEQRYRTIMMSVGDGVIATDSAGRVEMMNPVAEELTGWKQEEAQGNSLEKIFQIINEKTRQIVENPVRRVMREGIVVGLANHSMLIAKNGTEYPIADSGAPIRNEEGDITGMVLVFRDQTQERTSQRALQESERKFRETVTYFDEGYYSVTIDGLLLDHNQAFSRILGFDIAKDLKGAKLPDFWQVPEDRKQYLNELIAHGFIRNYMVNAKKINGEKIDVMMNSHLVKDEKGGLVRIDGTFTDFTERSQAEQLIKESERKYRILVENSLVGVFRTKVNGDVDYVNDSILRMLEFDTREDLLNIGALMRYKEPKQREELLKALKDSGKVEGFEANIITKKGNERVFLMNVVINGEILDGTLIDITQRKLAEEALKESERIISEQFEKLNEAQHIAMIGSWEWNLQTNHVWWSDETYRIFGVTPQNFVPSFEANGKFIHPDDVANYGKSFEHSFQTGEPLNVEFRLVTNDGLLKHCNGKGKIIYDDSGHPIRFVGTMMDITERKQVDQELREREARYKTLIENIPQKIFMKDRDYRFMSINENFARDIGISPEEIVGKLDRDLFSNELADKYHADDVRIITTGETEELEEKYVVDGKETWVNTIKTPVRDDKGEIVGLLGIFWDITARKLAEEEIRKLNTELEDRVVMRTAQLEASNKELEAFSYSVSHDLRAPLRHVSGYVELLNKHFQSDLPEKGLHYLNSIGDSVHIMGMLIDDLLQFSRTGRMEMHQSDLDMNEIVREVKESLCKDNPDRKIEWVLGKLPTVNGDEAMLRLVWMNLLSNAVKFTRTRKKARIEIGVSKENKELVFFVHDNGVGFDMKYAHKLFGVFQRLHSTEEFEGTGIGLANVHRIVLRQGGRTWAEAEPDKGAVFYFSIPNK